MEGLWIDSAGRLVTRYSGVAMLLALLISLPWLTPAASGEGSTISRTVNVNAAATAPIFQISRPASNFTVHLVASEPDLALVAARYPDPMTGLVFIILPEDEASFLRRRTDVDRVREDGRLPPLRIQDHRCDPAAPVTTLCSFGVAPASLIN